MQIYPHRFHTLSRARLIPMEALNMPWSGSLVPRLFRCGVFICGKGRPLKPPLSLPRRLPPKTASSARKGVARDRPSLEKPAGIAPSSWRGGAPRSIPTKNIPTSSRTCCSTIREVGTYQGTFFIPCLQNLSCQGVTGAPWLTGFNFFFFFFFGILC